MNKTTLTDAIALKQYNVIKHELTTTNINAYDTFFDALSTACCFGGAESLRMLIDGGIDMSKNEVYIMYMLDDSRHLLYPTLFPKSDYFNYGHYRCQNGQIVEPISKSEKLDILTMLLEKYDAEYIGANKLLFYAITTQNRDIIDLLHSHDVTISNEISNMLFKTARGPVKSISNVLFYMMESPYMYIEKLLDIADELIAEKPGSKIRMSTWFMDTYGDQILMLHVSKRIAKNFDFTDINKTAFIREHFSIEYMPVYETLGWLNNRKTRDKFIDYATQQNNVEITAWLLDFKNRTADLEKERMDDERKMMRDLNAAPDSVYALKQIWTYKKCDDGICITNCKQQTDTLNIPAKIGKSPVVRVEFSYKFNTSKIKSITIPEGVTEISRTWSNRIDSLEEVNLPSTLKEIPNDMFSSSDIKSITIPYGCEKIGRRAFAYCHQLKNVTLEEGIKHIDEDAFLNCGIEEITIPRSVEFIDSKAFRRYEYNRPNKDEEKPILIKVYDGSYGHEYCKKHFSQRQYEVIP